MNKLKDICDELAVEANRISVTELKRRILIFHKDILTHSVRGIYLSVLAKRIDREEWNVFISEMKNGGVRLDEFIVGMR